LTVLLAQPNAPGDFGTISGTAVNGTHGHTPLADAEIVLRASQEGAFVPVAQMTTDALGRFTFDELPLESDIIYLAGVNRAGVHYPGPRVRLDATHRAANIKLIAFDAIESPAPLISHRHEITVHPGKGFLDITETLTIQNPSLTAFIGTQEDENSPITLRLSLPAGFDKVTFDKEFHGRNFQIQGGHLTTGLPWPPGSRELKLTYRVPVTQRQAILSRILDLPTENAILRVIGKDIGLVTCNLPASTTASAGEVTFAHTTLLRAGAKIELQLRSVPLRFETYGRWLAAAALAALVTGSAAFIRRRHV